MVISCYNNKRIGLKHETTTASRHFCHRDTGKVSYVLLTGIPTNVVCFLGNEPALQSDHFYGIQSDLDDVIDEG